jgi:hypothetical protein
MFYSIKIQILFGQTKIPRHLIRYTLKIESTSINMTVVTVSDMLLLIISTTRLKMLLFVLQIQFGL